MTVLHREHALLESLWAAFEDKPASATAQCPLQQREVAIFPVRYAIDEAADGPGQPGPNPIPSHWQGHQSLPELNRRSYTLRQLRDGWLYVIDRTTNTLDEYQVAGACFARVRGSSQHDQPLACSPSTSHLLYPRQHQLYIAYSAERWTAWTQERMQAPANQAKWMRALDLATYVKTLSAPHCAPLRQLGETVADIDTGAAVPGQRFDSTTLPTQATDEDAPYKPVLGSNTVLADVPDQDSALFIALDDTLGILDDLSMQAAAPGLELSQFEEQHLHKLTIAQHIELLAGADFADLEAEMGLSPQAFHAFKQKAQRYLSAKARYLKELNSPTDAHSVVATGQALDTHQQQLVSEYGQNAPAKLDSLVEQWGARETLRDQVRFEESQTFVLEKEQALEDIRARLTPGLQDLITWLKRLGPDPLGLFLDQTDAEQCLSLIKYADAWLSFLAHDPQAQQWVIDDYAKPQTLIGLASYNFDAELASGIEQLVNEFVEQGGISVATAGSIAKRTQEISDVLSNETIRNSAIFQRLSKPAKEAYEALLRVAAANYEKVWQALEFKLLPAISSRHAPRWKTIAHATITVSIHSLVNETRPFLLIDSQYQQKHAAWRRKVTQLTRQIDAQTRVVTTGRTHDRMAAVRHVHQLKRQLESLMLEAPDKVIISVHLQHQRTQTISQTQTIQALVRSELAQQLELKARDYGAYLKRVNEWTKSNAALGLAGLITILNIWNFHETITAASADGEWNRQDQLAVSTAASSMLASLATMALIPAWSRISGLTGSVTTTGAKQQLMRLTSAAAHKWKSGLEYKALFKSFAMRAIAVSALSVIAAAAEYFQVQEEIGGAESEDRKNALRAKLFITAVIGAVAAFQLMTSAATWLGVMSASLTIAPWMVIALAMLGMAHLIISLISDSLKLEGFKLWLYRSSWGKASNPYWPDTEKGNADELRALHEVLLRPTVIAKTLEDGVWLKLIFPPGIAGHTARIHPMMVTEGNWFRSDRETGYRAGMYSGYMSEGRWIKLDELGEWDSLGVRNQPNTVWPVYQATDWRIWLVHIPRSRGMDRLDISIKYPPAVLQRPDNLGYRFSINLAGIQEGTLHENPYVKNRQVEPASVATSPSGPVKAHSNSGFNLGVI